MVIRGCARAALAVAVAVSSGGWAGAQQPLYGTSFDGPAYAPGSAGGPAAADGWSVAGPAQSQAVITPDQALRITSLNDPSVRGLSAAWVRQMTYDPSASGNPIVTYSADVRIDGPGTAAGRAGDVLTGNLVAFGDGATKPSVGQMWLSSNGTVYAGASGAAPGQFEAAAGLGVFQHLAMTLNFADMTASYFLNGQQFGTESFGPSVTSPILGGVVLGAGGPPDPTRYNVDDYAITFDNVSVTASAAGGGAVTTPEPTSLALAGLGIVALAGRRLRRKAG
jgi:hypothetical protein